MMAFGLAILGLLHQQPRSGYDLRKVFSSSPMGRYSSSPGSIYPALRRLEQRGLISGRVDRKDSMRPRRIFQPTSDGVDSLREWLSAPLTRDDIVWRMEELMLRFAFMDVADEMVTPQFLRSLAEEIEEYVLELTAHLDTMQGFPVHGRLALTFGIATFRAQAECARNALEEFERERNTRGKKA